MKKVSKAILFAIALVLVLAFVWTGCGGPAQSQSEAIQAPDFKLSLLNGGETYLSDFSGKPVMLNFWATWCPPCREEMPYLQQIHEQRSADVVVLTVNMAENAGDVEEFIREFGLSFPVLLDSNGDVAQQYGVRAIPTTFFIDKSGILQGVKIGAFRNIAEIESELEKIIP